MADRINLEKDEDLQAQIEEVEALSSIYGDEWCVLDEASRIFCIKISSDVKESKLTACLQIILPPDYPSASPPIYQINAAWLQGPERAKLANSLEDLYVEHVGESILYLWVEKIREFLLEKSQDSETADQPEKVNMTAEEEVDGEEEMPDFSTFKLNTEDPQLFMEHAYDEELPPIKHGNTITDRRSTFQPHIASVVTPRQVKNVLQKLYENKKIASATHNIYAYRIYCEDKHSFLQDCEDDGETAAGGRLLHLMQVSFFPMISSQMEKLESPPRGDFLTRCQNHLHRLLSMWRNSDSTPSLSGNRAST
ncbi:protein IMPACT isoform X2 [Antennarius striatus]|uniref:protein IMPACT isoform X2 n=1 Tax=Antennarius striatus TaxID=241820 RepID=UPI0035AF49C6